MEHLDTLRKLAQTHARRVRRLWWIGAAVMLVLGICVAGFAGYKSHAARQRAAEWDGGYDDDVGYADEAMLSQRITGAMIVGLGLSSMLVVMGFLAEAIARRHIANSEPIPVKVNAVATDTLVSATTGPILILFLSRIAPIRAAGFSFQHGGRDHAQIAHLFADEVPWQDETGQCWALQRPLLGMPAAFLVCAQQPPPQRIPQPADSPPAHG